MKSEECMALITYINQIDARVQLNEPTFDVWWMAMERHSFEQAKWCVKVYYATTNPNSDRGLPALSASMLRYRVSEQRERAESKRSAIAARPTSRSITGESTNAGRLRSLLASADSFKVPD